MRKKSGKQKTLQEIFDSDDELPTEYIEIPIVPAYQMDNRFDHIEKENEVEEREETDKEDRDKKKTDDMKKETAQETNVQEIDKGNTEEKKTDDTNKETAQEIDQEVQ